MRCPPDWTDPPEKLEALPVSPTHPLAQLMDSVKAANNWSDPDLVLIARRKGHNLTKSNISRYRNENPLISIKGEIIRALADALGVSVGQVATAAVQSMGIALPVYDAPSVEQAIRVDPELSIRDKDMLLSMLGQMREPFEKGKHDDVTTKSATASRPGETTSRKKTGAAQRRDVNNKPGDLTSPDPGDDLAGRRHHRDRYRPGPVETDAAAYDPPGPTDADEFYDGAGEESQDPDGGADS
ncbi:helix-turn-helix DNA binding domain protein [Gordonia phage LitninMcQueen]